MPKRKTKKPPNASRDNNTNHSRSKRTTWLASSRNKRTGYSRATPNTRKTPPAASPSNPPSMAGVILCGGSGTRMGRTRGHKVCVPVAGRPAVVRLIDTLRADGVDPLVAVVGHQAGDVVETIGSVQPGVHFVYQRDRLGTGHAARLGIEALCQFGYAGPVLITMGDKWLAPGLPLPPT